MNVIWWNWSMTTSEFQLVSLDLWEMTRWWLDLGQDSTPVKDVEGVVKKLPSKKETIARQPSVKAKLAPQQLQQQRIIFSLAPLGQSHNITQPYHTIPNTSQYTSLFSTWMLPLSIYWSWKPGDKQQMREWYMLHRVATLDLTTGQCIRVNGCFVSHGHLDKFWILGAVRFGFILAKSRRPCIRRRVLRSLCFLLQPDLFDFRHPNLLVMAVLRHQLASTDLSMHPDVRILLGFFSQV